MSDEYIPWTRETFPNERIFLKMKNSNEASTPDGILDKGVRLGVRVVYWDELFKSYEWSTGHHPVKAHWRACGHFLTKKEAGGEQAGAPHGY